MAELIQLRWQHIRSIETTLLIQNENIELRRMISHYRNEIKDSIQARSLREILRKLNSWCMKYKYETENFKALTKVKVAELVKENEASMLSISLKYSEILTRLKNEKDHFKHKSEKLDISYKDAKKELDALSSYRSMEHSRVECG